MRYFAAYEDKIYSYFIFVAQASSAALPTGGIIGAAIGAIALLVLVVVGIVVIRRRTHSFDDRNLYLYQHTKEGASIAYVPEYSIPKFPGLPNSDGLEVMDESQVSGQATTAKRLWQSKFYVSEYPENEAISQLGHHSDDDEELFSDGIPKSLFSTHPVAVWMAKSVVHADVVHVPVVGTWDEDEAKTEAQQRRKEIREANWARKKLERLASLETDGSSAGNSRNHQKTSPKRESYVCFAASLSTYFFEHSCTSWRTFHRRLSTRDIDFRHQSFLIRMKRFFCCT
jgi:hypothetical protein